MEPFDVEALAYQAQLVDYVSDAIIASDESFVTTAWNLAAEEMYGWTAEEVIGRPTLEFLHPEFVDVEPEEVFRRLLEEGHFEGQVIQVRKDGTRIHTEARARALRTKDGRITEFVSIDRDISERVDLQNHLVQSQKMEAIGRLAGGIAHDFNNLLTPIISYADIGASMVQPPDPLHGYFQEIGMAGERGAELTRQLLAFSRHQAIERRVVDLNQLIFNVDSLLRRLIGEDIELVFLPAQDLRLVDADPGQIEQVLINLAVNAQDAMPGGGRILIHTANITLDDEYARMNLDASAGEHAMVSVSDTGTGMTPEVMSQVVDPFFTTKEAGNGSGLGLSTCYGIVAQIGGHMTVESKPGTGTTFTICLPSTHEETELLPSEGRIGKLPLGSETVLLVEDEPRVRGVEALVLIEQGYTVLEAANGTEALRVARDFQEEIHLLVTDVVMPLMGGPELAHELAKIHPETKVLSNSGYADDGIMNDRSRADFLQKPFTPGAFARKVREVLDGGASQDQ